MYVFYFFFNKDLFVLQLFNTCFHKPFFTQTHTCGILAKGWVVFLANVYLFTLSSATTLKIILRMYSFIYLYVCVHFFIYCRQGITLIYLLAFHWRIYAYIFEANVINFQQK